METWLPWSRFTAWRLTQLTAVVVARQRCGDGGVRGTKEQWAADTAAAGLTDRLTATTNPRATSWIAGPVPVSFTRRTRAYVNNQHRPRRWPASHLYVPNPNDQLQAIDAVTGDLQWEYRRAVPDYAPEVLGGGARHGQPQRGDLRQRDHRHGQRRCVHAVDAAPDELAWQTEILDYRTAPVRHTSGPIIANGKVSSGRSCRPVSGPTGCVIVAHDAATGAELWRTRLVPRAGGASDGTWGGVPYEEPAHRLCRDVGDLPGTEIRARRLGPEAPLP